MANEIAILILKRIASKPECTIEDIRQVVRAKHKLADTPPIFMMNALKGLAKWGLIQAIGADDKVVPIKTFKRAVPKTVRFRLTDRVFQIEDELDIKLTRPPQPIFGKPGGTGEYPRIFVLMPFAPEYLDVYQKHIKVISESDRSRLCLVASVDIGDGGAEGEIAKVGV